MGRIIIIIFLILVFLAGMYNYSNNDNSKQIKKQKTRRVRFSEGLQDKKARCPNMLVKKGNMLFLFNTTDPQDEPPLQFNNLEEYVAYLENQRAQGLICPILFLQQENDVQGNDVYRIRPSIFDQQGGMYPLTVAPIIDSNRSSQKYNLNNYPGFDPYGLQTGVFNKLDEIHFSTENATLSDNPMDSNWGGVEFTQNSVESGKYDDNMVSKPVYFTPKTQFFPSMYGEPEPISFKGARQ
jgi:hypothetical protein